MTMAREGDAVQVAEHVWVLDTLFQGEPGVIASYLLAGPRGLALVDVGSAASVEQVLAGVRAAGFDPSEIEHLVLTHVHLDHAGAAGTLVRLLPRAQVYVHRIGAPHLVDPTKLVSSAQRIYGDRMQELWGTMEPVPAARITQVDEGDVLRVGSHALHVLYTPGHAIHHVALYDEAHNAVFAGDVAGVRLAGMDFVRPPTPPPDLNLEDWMTSIKRLDALHLETLYLPHFGRATGVDTHLAQLGDRLHEWGRLMLAGIREGRTDHELAADLAAHADGDVVKAAGDDGAAAIRRYELATNYLMSAQGYIRYYRKVHPELLA